MINWLKIGLILLGLSVSLSACGVRGGLEAPPEDKAAQKKERDSGEKRHKGFILDGLIR